MPVTGGTATGGTATGGIATGGIATGEMATGGWISRGTGGTTIRADLTVRGPMVTAGVVAMTVALMLGSGTGPTTGTGMRRGITTVGRETGRRLWTGLRL